MWPILKKSCFILPKNEVYVKRLTITYNPPIRTKLDAFGGLSLKISSTPKEVVNVVLEWIKTEKSTFMAYKRKFFKWSWWDSNSLPLACHIGIRFICSLKLTSYKSFYSLKKIEPYWFKNISEIVSGKFQIGPGLNLDDKQGICNRV